VSIPTTAHLRTRLGGGSLYGPLEAAAIDAAEYASAFHWPLAFPEVMIGKGGFDVALGNPPWERIKLQEQEFFATRAPEIALAPNAAARGKLIRQLAGAEPGSLPTLPLELFERETAGLGNTETERIKKVRIGQGIFRKALLAYWKDTCPITGITDGALLRASHIIPWARCESDAERLDVHNGLLLSSLWDAAFDEGLVTFDDEGRPIASSELTDAAITALQLRNAAPLLLTPEHRLRLAWHRTNLWQQ
jgi:hypothetical protein